MAAAYGGVYIGVVQSASDPGGGGRVQVTIQSLGLAAAWAPVCKAAGASGGKLSVGTKVVVAFEGGSPGQPIVLGQL